MLPLRDDASRSVFPWVTVLLIIAGAALIWTRPKRRRPGDSRFRGDFRL